MRPAVDGAIVREVVVDPSVINDVDFSICPVGVVRPLVVVDSLSPYVVAAAVVELLGVDMSPNCDEEDDEEDSERRAPGRAV